MQQILPVFTEWIIRPLGTLFRVATVHMVALTKNEKNGKISVRSKIYKN